MGKMISYLNDYFIYCPCYLLFIADACDSMTCTGNSNVCEAGSCKCGSTTSCTLDSTLPSCLNSAGVFTEGDSSTSTCKCASSTDCSSGTGAVTTSPVCSATSGETLGTCIQCKKSDGNAGDGTTQGTCASNKCHSDGQCAVCLSSGNSGCTGMI